MSGERSEQPTSKRLEQFRKDGKVAKSQELGGIITLFIGVYMLSVTGPRIADSLADVMQSSYRQVGTITADTLTYEYLSDVVGGALTGTVGVLAPWLVTLMVVGVVANLAQTKGLVQPRLLIPKWDRLNPLAKLKQMFGQQMLVETVKGLTKQTAIAIVVYFTVSNQLSDLMASARLGLNRGVSGLTSIAFGMALQAAALLLVIAMLDYAWQFHQHRKSLMMTKQEVREESKQQEGSPEVKSRIRRIQREMAQKRMMAEVPTADAVVVNPTHYAAAIRYDKATMAVPILVAKGKDDVAFQIIGIARKNNVPVVPNMPLARALYKLPLNASVPTELFQGVAQVLAFVYSLKNR